MITMGKIEHEDIGGVTLPEGFLSEVKDWKSYAIEWHEAISDRHQWLVESGDGWIIPWQGMTEIDSHTEVKFSGVAIKRKGAF
jgi:hypothetical protein